MTRRLQSRKRGSRDNTAADAARRGSLCRIRMCPQNRLRVVLSSSWLEPKSHGGIRWDDDDDDGGDGGAVYGRHDDRDDKDGRGYWQRTNDKGRHQRMGGGMGSTKAMWRRKCDAGSKLREKVEGGWAYLEHNGHNKLDAHLGKQHPVTLLCEVI